MQGVFIIRPAFVVWLVTVVFAVTAPGGAVAGDPHPDSGFTLLSLDNRHVKWGKPRYGTPAVIRYAFLATASARAAAINCRAMEPFPARLGTGRVNPGRVADAFRGAFSAWETVAGVRFERVEDAAQAELVLGVQADPKGIAYADVSAIPTSDGPLSSLRAAAICLNPDVVWETDFDGDDSTFNIQRVAVHEIGHILGLDHPDGRAQQIMSFKYRERVRLPQAPDIAGASLLYGPANEISPLFVGVSAEVGAQPPRPIRREQVIVGPR